MLVGALNYLRRHWLAGIALFVALGGSAYAGSQLNVVRGEGRLIARTVDLIGGDPEERVIRVPGFGRVAAECVGESVRVRYVNTTEGNQEVFRYVYGEGASAFGNLAAGTDLLFADTSTVQGTLTVHRPLVNRELATIDFAGQVFSGGETCRALAQALVKTN